VRMCVSLRRSAPLAVCMCVCVGVCVCVRVHARPLVYVCEKECVRVCGCLSVCVRVLCVWERRGGAGKGRWGARIARENVCAHRYCVQIQAHKHISVTGCRPSRTEAMISRLLKIIGLFCKRAL